MTADPGVLGDSRAILIGVSAYEYAELPPIRAARNSLRAMQALLTDPALCSWPSAGLTVIANPISAADLAGQIADLAENTTGVLLLYYVGHGLLSARGELCLTVTSTRPDRPKISGLAWDTVADVLRTCPAIARVAILDCCFAGQAIEALAADNSPGLADIVHIAGVYTLTATTRNRTAHVPPPDQQDTACTSFTGELHDLIRRGIPGGPPELTFADIYPVLRQRLQAKDLPTPNQRGTDTIFGFPFTANATVHAHDESRSVGETSQMPTRSDRGYPQANRLWREAIRVAHLIESEGDRTRVLAAIRGAQVDSDPDQARGLAQSNTDERETARALAAPGPDKAERLFAEAERLAQSITDNRPKRRNQKAPRNRRMQEQELPRVATELAPLDPDRAEHLAQLIPDDRDKAKVLAAVVEAVAASDPDRAERIARSITHYAREKAEALTAVAKGVAAADPDRVERIAQTIEDAWLLADIAESLAVSHPHRAIWLFADAERVAHSRHNYGHLPSRDEAVALSHIARAMNASEPSRARELFADAERLAQSITGERKSQVLAQIAKDLAASDPSHAERIAQSIPDGLAKDWVLAHAAKALTVSDLGQAERIAQSINDKAEKALALTHIAKTMASNPSEIHPS